MRMPRLMRLCDLASLVLAYTGPAYRECGIAGVQMYPTS